MITCYKRKEAKAKARCAPLTWSTAWRDPAWSCDACRPSRAPRRRTPPSTAAWPPHIAELPVASSRLCCLEDCCFVSMWFWDPIIALWRLWRGPCLAFEHRISKNINRKQQRSRPSNTGRAQGPGQDPALSWWGQFFFFLAVLEL